jgi:hypothetical protein
MEASPAWPDRVCCPPPAGIAGSFGVEQPFGIKEASAGQGDRTAD